MASIIMAAASPGLLSVVMDIKPLDSGTAIVTDLPASDSENAGIYVSDSHVGTETGLHRVTVRQGSKILAAWYVDLTNTGNRDIAYDSDKIINTNNDKTGYNVTSGQVDDVIQPVTCGGGVVGTVTGNVDGSVGSVNDVANIADGVWDEPRAGHIAVGSFGQFVISQVIAMEDNIITSDTIAPNAIGSDQLAVTAIDEIADGVWDELRAEHTTVGTFGEGVNIPDVEWKRLWEQVTLAEGYATSGVIHSASQIMYMVMSILQNPQYVNFEFRARRLDGTTEAGAFQMDDDTNPTSHNRIR